MPLFTFDCESHLIKPGCAAPRMVCISTASESGKTQLLDRVAGLRSMKAVLEDKSVIVIGHNVFYDLGLCCAEDPATFVPLVFKAFDDFRIRDTIIRQQLIDIATGNLKYRLDEETQTYVKTGYTLADLVLRILGRVLPKEDTWRLKYALLDGVPISEWPADAKKYAVDDAVATREVFLKQQELILAEGAVNGVIPTEERATRDAWSLWLMSAWGVRTDGEAVAKLKAELEAEQVEANKKLQGTGIIKPKGDGWSRDMKEIYKRVRAGYEAQGLQVPTTESGRVSSAYESLVDCLDPDLAVLADAAGGAKLLNTYVPVLESGALVPINARFNVLVESNRTSCEKPNLQNLPRKSNSRTCFTARPGYVYASVDYDTIELRALAQSCLDLVGNSEMAEALRRGEDLHLSLAADFLGISREDAVRRYEEGDSEVADMRQMVKPANFGFPGGMASDSFVEYAKGYGYDLDRGLSKRLHEQWFRTWPEMRAYFEYVSRIVGKAGQGTVVSPRSGFVRGGLTFTQLSNHYFQSLTATGAKDALWHVSRECYSNPSSALWASRPVVFVHDEIITEMPEDRASDAAELQAKIMVDVMSKWIPEIPIKAGPVLMRKWHKGAKAVRINGRLVPSRPEEIDGKIKWVADLA
jgi:DNA polymerase family A/3'-5' exonuclease